ncbi:Zinc finger protein C3H1.11 [Wallemia ichthyophaga EXF-994]|uniref:Zinc finger protein C3H1.11 n=1 Tax=Wallemia ichthyophaga (strain EXF-994 / CBS 113033) TaxID=1299270 RepID=R9AND9_WALI9|nr:Zinc finger protein C3H1.11 [Wallemia ichthyophaga EXF-994]EOR03737.1 Zinc finger protein C3H1.11 [Wallemia ichthyophaga EXF-994]
MDKNFRCDYPNCHSTFTRPENMMRHKRNIHRQNSNPHICKCGKAYSRSDILLRHQRVCAVNLSVDGSLPPKHALPPQPVHPQGYYSYYPTPVPVVTAGPSAFSNPLTPSALSASNEQHHEQHREYYQLHQPNYSYQYPPQNQSSDGAYLSTQNAPQHPYQYYY